MDAAAPLAGVRGVVIGVKVCGIRTAEALEAAQDADWVGLVFFSRSPRAVTAREAERLLRGHRGPVRVGLFVSPSERDVAEVLDRVAIDVLQIYGAADLVARLRQRFGLPVWHAVGVSCQADLPMRTGADALVIEAKPPPASDRPGGNATAIDPDLTAGWQAPSPWLLAGGLTADNVADAIRRSGAVAVDVSSGVEAAPGLKDPDLVARFIAAARAAT